MSPFLFSDTLLKFASAESFELNNSYQNALSLTLNAPAAGNVMLTGCGMFSLAAHIYSWATVCIGAHPATSENNAETGLELPTSGWPQNAVVLIPFSLTTVVPVRRGANTFYMVGIKDPNPVAISLTGIRLTALFVRN